LPLKASKSYQSLGKSITWAEERKKSLTAPWGNSPQRRTKRRKATVRAERKKEPDCNRVVKILDDKNGKNQTDRFTGRPDHQGENQGKVTYSTRGEQKCASKKEER